MIPTVPGGSYDLSFWLRNFDSPNRFQVYWDGQLIFDQIDMPNFDYTLQSGGPFSGLIASTDSTALTFGYYNLPDFFFLDDIVVVSSAAARH
jgi:hypothetical protein